MNLSKTSEYAISILAFMSLEEESQFSATHLHKKLKIPYSYLRRLLTKLSKAGFIRSNKGKSGGFTLNQKTTSIYLSDIIEAIEGFEFYESCIFGFEKCVLDNKCAMHDKWVEATDSIKNILKTTNLAELKDRSKNLYPLPSQ